MILRDHNSEFALPRPHEDGVARPRPAGIYAFCPRLGDGRRDDIDFFLPKTAAFAGVWVQAGHGDAGRGDAGPQARPMRKAYGGQFGLWSDQRRNRRQWDMDGGKHNAQFAIGQHHGVMTRVRLEEHTSELQSLMRMSYAVF